MPVYSYEAKTKQGAIRKGKMDAVDEEAVTSALREIDVYPISIKQFKETSFNIDLAELRKVTLKDIYIFCREFSYIVSSGMGILRALEILREQTENPRLKKVIINVSDSVQKGESLSSSMMKYKEFPDMLVNMIAVGEASGTLDEVMLRMANFYNNEYKQQQKVKQALTYPMMISIFSIVVVNVLVIKVLPTFTNMSEQNGISASQLPLPTKIVTAFSNFMINYWYVILIAIIAVVILMKRFINGTRSIAFDKYKLTIPLFGPLNKKVVTARFARTFGMLIGTGISVVKSIEISAEIVGNNYVKDILLKTKGEIERGAGIGETLQSREIFPLMLVQMIKIGEESGTIDSVLTKTAEFYDGEVEVATAQLTTMIEPIIIAVLGFVVGFIVISIILPMFQMYSSFSK